MIEKIVRKIQGHFEPTVIGPVEYEFNDLWVNVDGDHYKVDMDHIFKDRDGFFHGHIDTGNRAIGIDGTLSYKWTVDLDKGENGIGGSIIYEWTDQQWKLVNDG